MASKNEAISVRSARLDQIVLGHDAGSKNGRARVGEGLNRESLLDALSVLYNECHKESQKNADKQVAEFVQKCKRLCLPECLFGSLQYPCFLFRSPDHGRDAEPAGQLR